MTEKLSKIEPAQKGEPMKKSYQSGSESALDDLIKTQQTNPLIAPQKSPTPQTQPQPKEEKK